ncbi:MAG: MFS transporter [Actinobacteria bacterium]|nr:MFS transporter [Actinomycetota bacterium]|tara:strand:- start:258 stop:953 length:696 start_codon:yes stop_codon:yes gene_type:complete
MQEQVKQAQLSLLSLMITIVIPSLILIFSKKQVLISPEVLLCVALSFPVSFALYEWVSQKHVSFISIFGFISVLLTGGIGVFRLPSEWIAVKESLIPFIIGMVLFVMSLRGKPSMEFLLKSLFDLPKIQATLTKQNKLSDFTQIMIRSSYLLSLSFFISAMLNFFLASFIVQSPSGTAAFNEEIGFLTAISYPVIALPCMIILGGSVWYVVRSLKQLTGLSFSDLLHVDYQ